MLYRRAATMTQFPPDTWEIRPIQDLDNYTVTWPPGAKLHVTAYMAIR
jgi:hypothetical protein